MLKTKGKRITNEQQRLCIDLMYQEYNFLVYCLFLCSSIVCYKLVNKFFRCLRNLHSLLIMPGSRHAKNNTALGYFTRHERESLGWGSKKKRLTKDSIKKFYACTICLKLCDSPLICPNGDLFCKECIYQSLLTQKRKNKQKSIDYQQQQLENNRKLKDEHRKNTVDKFLQFDRLQNNVSSSSSTSNSKPLGQENTNLSSLNKTPFTNTPSSNVLDVSSSNPNDKKLSCFWIPSVN